MAIGDIDDNLGAWSSLVSIELFTNVCDNLNHLIDSVPPGQVVPICVGLPGVPAPDPTMWQECNGSLITEQLSDLRGHATPDLRDRYIKGAASPSTCGLVGGSHYVGLTHNHGNSGSMNPKAEQQIVDGSDHYWSAVEDHTHTIQNDLGGNRNFEPYHIHVKLFLKIR